MVSNDDVGGEEGAEDEVEEVDCFCELAVAGVVVGVVVAHVDSFELYIKPCKKYSVQLKLRVKRIIMLFGYCLRYG